jgi:GDPmannose 4,6-dehydratase
MPGATGAMHDYVEGMWRILQHETADDWVLATGEAHTVREFVELAFAETGRELAWTGAGVEEKGRDRRTGQVLVEIDPRYFRPLEVDHLQGDARKAADRLGWRPRTTFRALVHEMVAADLDQVAREHQANGRLGLEAAE